MVKAIYEKHKATVRHNGECLKALALKWGKKQGRTLSTLAFNKALNQLDKKKKVIHFESKILSFPH